MPAVDPPSPAPDSALSPAASLDGVYVVSAAYNEAGMIPNVLADLSRYLPLSRVIVVDDASADDTSVKAREAGAVVIRHLINRGQGAALATGIAAALRHDDCKAIITFDSDGQHVADDLPDMAAPLLAGKVDVTLGTRFHRSRQNQIPPVRRALLKILLAGTRLITRLRLTDAHNGFRGLSRHAAQTIRIRQDRMEHASEILDQVARHKLRYAEVPVTIRYTHYSLAKGQRNRAALGLAMRIVAYKVTTTR